MVGADDSNSIKYIYVASNIHNMHCHYPISFFSKAKQI